MITLSLLFCKILHAVEGIVHFIWKMFSFVHIKIIFYTLSTNNSLGISSSPVHLME